MDKKKIAAVANEAVRLMKENEDWPYKQAIEKAREIYKEAK